LNPGNIGDHEHIKKVVLSAKERRVPIRIGLNSGSLLKSPRAGMSVADRMVEAAIGQVRLLESLDFDLIKVSLKAFDVRQRSAHIRASPKKYLIHCTLALPRQARRAPALSEAV